jgi:hypothetical protein
MHTTDRPHPAHHETENAMHLQANTMYHLGKRPMFVMITALTDTMVWYKEAPFKKNQKTCQVGRDIFHELSIIGCHTWFRMAAASYQPDLDRAYRALMSGEAIPPNAGEYRRLVIVADPSSISLSVSVSMSEMWGRAEHHGRVMMSDGRFEIELYHRALAAMEQDPYFTIVSITER